MNRLRLALAFLLAAVPLAQAQQTRSQLNTFNAQTFNANGRNGVTGPAVNNMNGQFINSFGALDDTNPWHGLNTFDVPIPASSGGTGGTGGVSPTGSLKTTPATLYYVADYGGVCDGTAANGTADTLAINRIFALWRSLPNNASRPTMIFPGNPSINAANGDACYITSTINATSAGGGADALSSQNFVTIGGGRLECHTSGTPCFDMSGSRFFVFNGLVINGPSGADESSYGLQIARIATGQPAGDHYFDHVIVKGFFKKAAVISFASEVNTWIAPYIANNDTTANYALIDDGCNHFNVTSAFTTQTIAQNTATSDLQDNFIGGQISSGAGTIVAPVFLCNTLHHEYKNVYINSNSAYAFHFFGIANGEPQMTDLDVHVETGPTVQNTIFFENNSGNNLVINGLRFRDSATNASVSLLKANSNLTSVTIHNFDVEIGKFAQGSGVQLFDNAALYAVDGGTIRLPSLSNWQPPAATFTENTSETVCLVDQAIVCETPTPTIALNRNPNFVMDQPNEGSANLIASNGAIVTDGWHEINSGALLSSLTFQRDTTAGSPNNLPFFYNLQATVTATKTVGATNFYNISTNIEGADMAPLRWGLGSQGAPLIIDYCLWSSVAPVTVPMYLANTSAARFYNIDNVISTPSAWKCFTSLVPPDVTGSWAKTANSIGLKIGFAFGNGSANSAPCVAGSWQSSVCYSTPNSTQLISQANGTVFHIGSLRVYNSFVDNPDLTPPYSQVLAKSQRWYRKSFTTAVKPAQNLASLAGAVLFQSPWAQATNATASSPVAFPPMFSNNGATTSTATFFSTNAASANCYNVTRAADSGAASAVNLSESGFLLQCTLVAGDALADQLAAQFSLDSGF